MEKEDVRLYGLVGGMTVFISFLNLFSVAPSRFTPLQKDWENETLIRGMPKRDWMNAKNGSAQQRCYIRLFNAGRLRLNANDEL